MKSICIIPAHGGSKRIKNIIWFNIKLSKNLNKSDSSSTNKAVKKILKNVEFLHS